MFDFMLTMSYFAC